MKAVNSSDTINILNQQMYLIKYNETQFVKYNSWQYETATSFDTLVPKYVAVS